MPTSIVDTRISQDSVCTEYMHQHLSYSGCVKDYQYDSDFYTKEMRGYLGLNAKAWQTPHDTLTLRDEKGLIVDTLSF